MTEFTAKELYDDIVAARGGGDALSLEHKRVAHALARALARADVDPLTVEKLTSMLPTSQRLVAGPAALQVTFVDQLSAQLLHTPMGADEAVQLIAKRNDELDAENKALKTALENLKREHSGQVSLTEPRQTASVGHGEPSGEKTSNVVAIRSTQYGNGTLNPAMDTWKRGWPEY
jgi:hypothetical protein